MTVRLPLTLPPYTPSTWELELPGYPVITGSWRSSAFPELLGSLPSDSKWSLTFENLDDDEALALMLPWTATGGGQWPLTTLPDELAGGVDNANFRKRLTGTIWTMAQEPRKESIKNGRFNVTVELVYELTFESVYGPDNPIPPKFTNNPIFLGIAPVLSVAGLPTDFVQIFYDRAAGPVLELGLSDNLDPAWFPIELDKTARFDVPSSVVLSLALPDGLAVAGLPASYNPLVNNRNAEPVIDMNLSGDMAIAGLPLQGTDIPVNSITYNQSSVFPSTFAADNLSMTDKTLVNTGAATDLGNPAWIKMNLGRNYGVAKVVIGTATNAIPGSWDKSYTENKVVEYSSDDINWTTAFNTGTFAAEGIYEFAVNFTARHIRIRTTSNDYVALSEFYALGAGQTY